MADTVTATRDKRATAGKRMSSLVGEAQDADDAFWGHDTWEEDDSGNDSFRESDEDSEVRKDQFDSDFDESEDDVSDAEAAAGREEEADLAKEEKANARKKTFDVARAGRELLQKKKGAKGRMKGQRIFGDGVNAGLVLNMPMPQQGHATEAPSSLMMPPRIKVAPTIHPPTQTSKLTLASTRMRRNRSKSLRATTQVKSAMEPFSNKPSKKGTSTKKSRIVHWTQEQLLLEAATVTEPENERWLLGRKRLHDQAEAVLKLHESQQKNGSVLSKYRSRRGMLTTLTFSEMDAVPDILVQQPSKGPLPRPRPVYCAITGQRAKYKCPKTHKGYYDLAAFTELRRRLAAGEPLDQRKHKQEDDVPVLQVEPSKAVPASPIKLISTAQRTVESPNRRLTMTTRMATKHPTDSVPSLPVVDQIAITSPPVIVESSCVVAVKQIPPQAAKSPAAATLVQPVSTAPVVPPVVVTVPPPSSRKIPTPPPPLVIAEAPPTGPPPAMAAAQTVPIFASMDNPFAAAAALAAAMLANPSPQKRKRSSRAAKG